MQLSRNSLKNIAERAEVVIPDEEIFSLPEKVLQFGTGVLLRGLPDYVIDKANRQQLFNGRVVVVKSTSSPGIDDFALQDNLYTLCVRGIEHEKMMEEFIINSSISRVLSAKENWDDVLRCAHNPDLKIVISNTTEVGIALTEDDIHLSPPKSFPGKLLAFLHERYIAFKDNNDSGLIVIPTELITDNGQKLRSIVLELARMNRLDHQFIHWLEHANHFCNSLVDRIVPGKLQEDDRRNTESRLGYKDRLMIMTESFRLWAIESADPNVVKFLSFAAADQGVIIAPNIEKFRELKLRLLNGTHSFSCGLAFLAGFKTVREAMNDSTMSSFVCGLASREIAMSIVSEKISYVEACDFADKVMDRFRNPFLNHAWLNIAVQYSSKMKMRNVPLIVEHFNKYGRVPHHMALGFAAYILFMKCNRTQDGDYIGHWNGYQYPVEDDHASSFAEKWKFSKETEVVNLVLADPFWESDLSSLNGFGDAVKRNLRSLIQKGVLMTIREIELNKTAVGS